MTLPYDSDGNFISASNADSNWAYSEITMNTNIAAYNACENPTLMAKKAFIHEVGHAFKLKHPTINPALSGHTYGSGYPYAIMNQGSPSNSKPWVSYQITQHDKDCLIAKWGA